nr:MAG TPA: hypothetical protein [Caudoviricetes sp.]
MLILQSRISKSKIFHIFLTFEVFNMNYIKDVALYNGDRTVNGIIEICKGTSDKNELVDPAFNELKCVR